MPGAWILILFCYGLSTVAAQALLFREYLAGLDGRDMGVGLFFGAWLLWAALGTWIFRRAQRLRSRLAQAAELVLLACIPAFCLQYGLFVFLREAAGAESHAFATLWHILGCSLLVTAPGCLLTGFLLPLLCSRFARSDSLAVGRVCTWAGAGGVLGGLGVAGLLQLGLGTASIFLLLSVLLCGAVAWSVWTTPGQSRRGIARAIAASCLIVVLTALGLRADVALAKILRERQWDRLAPDRVLEGRFSTAKGEYLYGADNGRRIVTRNGRVYETIGDQAAAGKAAALALSQNTNAERVLVIGDGLSVCASFLKSANVKVVDWFVPDQQYVPCLLARLPEALGVSDSRLQYLAGDPRTTLAGRPDTYDIVVVNFPGAVSAALDPFLSFEFFEQVNRSLRSLGLFVLGIEGAESDAPGKPAYLGACVKNTLDAAFGQTILVPAGQRTFFLSAPAPYLQVSPIALQTRFSLLENAETILPPEELSSVYRPVRASEMLDSFDAAALPAELVITDRNAARYLGQLLQTAHDSGLPLIEPAQTLLRGGLLVVMACLGVLALVRIAYVLGTTPRRKQGFDPHNSETLCSDVLTVMGGSTLAAFATFIVLVYAYQRRFGTLHLHVGFLSAALMLGLAVGAAAVGGLLSSLRRAGSQPVYFVLCVLLILMGFHAVCLVGAGVWIERSLLTQHGVAVWILLTGFFTGGALAAGAKLFGLCDLNAELAAARLGSADHLGAALGAGLAAFVLIPLLGLGAALYVLAAFVLANLASTGAVYRQVARPGRRVAPHPVLTPAGYSLFAVTSCVVVSIHLLSYLEKSHAQAQATTVIGEWVEGRRVSAKTTTVAGTSKTYHEVRAGSRLTGYIFRSEDFTGTVYGYAGPMSVIAFADPNGTLIDFRITRSRETPRYISRIRGWMDSLKGKKVFGDNPMAGVNTVSGATLSSDAILRLLRNSGREFAVSVFGQHEAPQVTPQHWTERVNWPLACWGASAMIAVGAILHGRFWSRLVLLALTVGVAGFWLNKQFSTDHVIRLLSADGLLAGTLGGLCLLLGVPLLILLFGNLYCGYLCPFGALQELVSLIAPKRFKARLSLPAITLGRSLKYGVLFVLVVAFFTVGSKHLLEADPLTSAFDRQAWSGNLFASLGLILAILALLGSLFVTRLWCRYVCPTGAFLSLFNRAGWLARLLPAKKFGRCEFGLGGRDHADCIYCDRCRYTNPLVPTRDDVVAKTGPNAVSGVFLGGLLALALLTLSPLRKAPPAPPAPTPSEVRAAAEIESPTERPFRQQRQRRGRRR
ncbi:MAG: 4Fe-4S binding protein [Sedimentisphaerales bacterium]|nr:4Fe-4S binding protein [Sedimentisphaerales bacterium]